jgi:hypothetical protein
MPKTITTAQEFAYLRALAETGNATLAAERAGVSRTWAYKKRAVDAWFAERVRELTALAGERLRPSASAQDERDWDQAGTLRLARTSPPHPPIAQWVPPSPAMGRGANSAGGGAELVVQVGLGKRAQVRRARAGQWTPRLERRFLEALAATLDVPLAARQVGMSSVSAYRHRMKRPDFAWRWYLAVRVDHAEMGTAWMETVICMLDGEPVRPDAPVQVIGVGDVIRLYERSLGVRRGRPMRL